MRSLQVTRAATMALLLGLAPAVLATVSQKPAYDAFVKSRSSEGEQIALRQAVQQDFNGDGKVDSLALFTGNYRGGNGSVQHLVLFLNQAGRLQPTDRLSRDDLPTASDSYAPILEGIALQGRQIRVKLATFRADDPHCCPSSRASWSYQVRDGKLQRG